MAFVLAQLAFTLLNMIQDFFWEMGSTRWTQLINSFLGPWAFVWCGMKTAPRFQAVVAAILATLFSFIAIVLA
ncbi:MAG TPA: hypothetical protein VGF13_21305, partial [Verrucomicrobiae bacterium]